MASRTLCFFLILLPFCGRPNFGFSREVQDRPNSVVLTDDQRHLEKSQDKLLLSGIYPQLAMFNTGDECGTGAVVPWADRLWVITYSPHSPKGSDDKLYEITPELEQIIRPESIGGTPANRMIHEESQQLFIGPYAIASDRTVRPIPYSEMFGRPTGNARHLKFPAEKILYATMEEGIYEVDVQSLDVTEHWGDEQNPDSSRRADFPGYHGKGFYSGQGTYIYANNGEHGAAARIHPEIPSGILAEWDGEADSWNLVRRNQFTEVTGPGGIHGNRHPEIDPLWTVGWDAKSLLLGVRMPKEGWSFYRLPKGSHSYDGAHGWNTEWPRIREIGEKDFLMTMHGTFWRFPPAFTPSTSAGIAPRSNYLKVIGDFCRWGDRVVLGCDDTAKLEFLNKRSAKGEIAAPQSQSNLWFIEPDQLDKLGPVIGRGGVWASEEVKAKTPSDPYLFSGYDERCLHLVNASEKAANIQLEVDKQGNGAWTALRDVEVPAKGYDFVDFSPEETGAWIRLVSEQNLDGVTATFSYRNKDERTDEPDEIFAGIARPKDAFTGAILLARAEDQRTLSVAAVNEDGSELGYYELNGDLKLERKHDSKADTFARNKASIPPSALQVDEASVLFVDDYGNRWRLPKGDPAFDEYPLKDYRVDREVATERDLFNAHGTFFEVPADNAGGFAKARAVATHNRFIHDYCSYRGLFVVSGVDQNAPQENPHIIRSDDGKTAVWAGAIDDIWKLGKPRGVGGPWKQSSVAKDVPSDPYLMTGYDHKTLELSHSSPETVEFQIEVDISGTGDWHVFKRISVPPGEQDRYEFPDTFSAYWVRLRASEDTTATGQFEYR